jgi:4'-phosphopantetheinyl transferase EntD
VDTVDLRSLFPVEVRAVLRPIPEVELALTPAEASAVKRALPKRRREFAAGRAFAREILEGLGVAVTELPRRSDGRTKWPSGVIGTISHTNSWCAAVVSNRTEALGIGVDIEELGRMSPGASRQVLSTKELDESERSELGRHVAWTVRFSTKESIYKCLYPLVRRYIGFREAEIGLDAEGRCDVHLDSALMESLPPRSRLEGRYIVTPDHVVTACTLINEELGAGSGERGME